MSVAFIDVVEDVKRLSSEEQEQLRELIDDYLVEARRDEIFANFQQSLTESPESSTDLSRLKELLDA